MPTQHVAAVTDCIESIAFAHGVLPAFVWDHPDNADLRELRKHQNVLLEGDVVVIPDRRPKTYDRATERTHTFVRHGVPAFVAFRVLRQHRPVPDTAYTLTIGSTVRTGRTDGDGQLRVAIQPDARTGELRVHTTPEELVYVLYLGALDPVDEPRGWQQRLVNLGYPVPDEELGTPGAGSMLALTRFQREQGLTTTAEPDDATRDALVRLAGR